MLFCKKCCALLLMKIKKKVIACSQKVPNAEFGASAIGHSAYGLLALEYAKKHKEHVSHVVIIGIPPHMRPDHIEMAHRNWDESVWPDRKAAFERNMKLMPDEKLNQLPRDEWFLQMNFRNVPKSWYDYNF